MTFGTARDLSSQVVAIPMTSFGMHGPHVLPCAFAREVYSHHVPGMVHHRLDADGSPASSVIETVAVLVFTPPGWKVMTMLRVFPTASGEDEA